MTFDLYLSEMAVSDRHGGGVTLQAVLGVDIEEIQKFVHVGGFGRSLPPIQQLLPRSVFLETPFDKAWLQNLLGRRFSAWCNRQGIIHRYYAKKFALWIKQSSDSEPLKILVVPQGKLAIEVLEALKKIAKVEYVTWVMDDHVVLKKNGEWSYGGFHEYLRAHLAGAKHVFVISPAMQQLYKKLFNIDSSILFGPASDSQELVASSSIVLSEPIKIAYFGSVWNWQRGALVEFVDVAKAHSALVHHYSSQKSPAELIERGLEYRGALKRDQVSLKMKEYHAALIPISFGEDCRNLVDLNIATKLGECLVGGTVTLIYGPPNAAMIRYVRDANVAIIADQRYLPNWDQIVEWIFDGAKRKELLVSAEKFVAQNMSTDIMHSRWREGVAK